MAKKNSAATTQKRKPRLLWANPFCLLDTSSGASMSVRQMLHQLVASGYEVQVLGATVFDNPKGMGQLNEQYPDLAPHLHQLVEAEDGPLTHQLIVTQRPVRRHLTAHEEGLWHSQYSHLLDTFKPDAVWFYGGQTLDLLIADEARARGIPSAFYLVNENYKAARWCRDVDLILTDTRATSKMYREKIGFVPTPVGKFIDTQEFVAEHNSRERLLFVNPSWPKGASVFVQLAEKLERERPDIPIEVVEARADWSAVLRDTTRKLGSERERLANVMVTPNTSDMREPYSRARVLIAPSLWWESGARVLAEAMLNGIPAIVSDSGGNAGMVGDGGMVVDLPQACFEKPYQYLLSDAELQPLFDAVVALFDDEALYQDYVARATRLGKEQHHISVSTERLVNAFAPLVNQRAGSKDLLKAQRRGHKHKLAGAAGKPEFKAMPIPTPQAHTKLNESMSLRSPKAPSGSFDWQFKGKVIVLDNRAKLIQSGALDKLLATKAFGVVAFDPASEVQDAKQYEGSESVQVFQHALLGDGKPGTLYTCLAPEMSSTLEPLPAEQLSQQRRQEAKVLTKLPINTIALDHIAGLDSLDWLILDELSDAVTILEHGKQALKDTLLVQARVAFQPTHDRQPSLAELQHWASRNGFRFYRFNDASYQSLFPQDSQVHQQLASELQSLDALFLPTEERLSQMDDNRKQKLVFLLHTVFEAQDMAYQVMALVNEMLAKNYLKFVEGEERYSESNDAIVTLGYHDESLFSEVIKVGTEWCRVIEKIASGQTSIVYRVSGGRVVKKVIGTVSGLFEREVFWLNKLSASNIVPRLHQADEENGLLLLEDVGCPIDAYNCPSDYKVQMAEILKKLYENNCRHNDISQDEVMVKGGVIKLIDFGWASYGDDYTCGGVVSGQAKDRRFFDEDAASLIEFCVAEEMRSTEMHCCISWGGGSVEDIVGGLGASIVQRFEINKRLIGLALKKKNSPIISGLVAKGFDKSEAAEICVFLVDGKGVDEKYPRVDYNISFSDFLKDAGNVLFSKNIAECREMLLLATFFRGGQPYSYWREWWGKAFDRKEVDSAQFQDKRQGMEDRWGSIKKFLERNVQVGGTVLDVGSNLGDTVNRVAGIGYHALGLEYDPELVKKSREHARSLSKFEVAEVSPGYVRQLGRFDAVFLLSVLHRMWAIKGKKYAELCLKEFSFKSNFIYFEGAVALQRYYGEKKEIPPFMNNDVGASIDWHYRWLNKHLVGKWDIRFLGVVPHTSSEPYRVLFSAEKVGD